MRAFIAIEIPENVKANFLTIQNELKKITTGITYVDKEKTHLTLRFFPDINEKEAIRIKEVINQLDFEPFLVRCKGVGVFPNEKFIRVIWIGADSNGMIEELERDLSSKLEAIKIIGDKKDRFTSHITIGRVKRRVDFRKIRDIISKYKDFEFGNFVLSKEQIKLKKSELTPKGPIYTDL